GATLEILAIGQHRQAGGAVRRVIAGDLGRLKVGADDAFRWAGLLDFGNHRCLAGRDLAANGADEIARRGLGRGFGLDDGKRLDGQRRSHLFTLGGDDLVEDVAHANCLVQLMNCSSLARAAPAAITSKAASTPSTRVAAWP